MQDWKNLNSGSTLKLFFLATLIFLQLTLSAQTAGDDYAKEYIKVEAFKAKSLPQSALQIIDQILSKAKKEKNQPEQVKAILYKIELSAQIEEDEDKKAILLVANELKTATFPASAIYHSIQAELYWTYYSNHRYQWLNRTITRQFENDDIKTWDLQKLISKVIEHHLLALANDSGLMKIPRKDYQVLLKEEIFYSDQERQEAIRVRPSLYDFLAHRAIDRFMYDETSLTHPADRFLIDDTLYLAYYSYFVPIQLHTLDTLSLKFYALKLLQDLLVFHQFDKDPAALIDADLKRLDYVYNNTVIEDKSERYAVSLLNLQTNFSDNPVSADVAYKRVLYLSGQGNLYRPLESPAHKEDIVKAIAICDEINKKFPTSNGAKNCRLLKKQFQEVSLTLTLEEVVIPDKPILGLLNYKNVNTLYWRLIAIDPSHEKQIRQSGDSKKILNEYLSMATYKSGNITLPDTRDYQPHKVQIPLPATEMGYYVILLSTEPTFNPEFNPLSYTAFWSSNISYISRKNNANDYEIYVRNRLGGDAIKGATVEAWFSDYDYKSRTRKDKLWKSFISDENGFVPIKNPSDNIPRSFYILIKSGKDQLASDDYFYIPNYSARGEREIEVTYLFTDRSIYRPGQTIYYKGIVLKGKANDLKVRPGYNTLVVLYDVNDRDIGETKVVTNEFGSFSGTFTAPAGTLNGSMRLANEFGLVEIRVEEYKRPRFEPKLLPVEGEYELNSMITVQGKALNYAGNPVDGATVNFRVVRTARFPYWWDYQSIRPTSAGLEITNGSTRVNSQGEFQVSFRAIPDRTLPKASQPVFHYEIYADVIDLNGELRSATTSVSVGYNSFILGSDVEDEVNADKLTTISISAKNHALRNVIARGKISIYKLQEPERVYRSRKWAVPDEFVMKEEEFHKLFPFDVYKNEDDKTTWEKAAVALNVNFNLPGDSVINLPELKGWPAGNYCLILHSLDKSGDTIHYKKFFTLYSEEKKKLPGKVTNWLSLNAKPQEPGTTTIAFFGTAHEDVHVLYELIQETEVISRNWINVDDEMVKLSIPVLEEYRGNIGVSFTFIKQNRCYQLTKTLSVPFTNKDLDISFETFRDKLQPGEKEQWRMKISGSKKEKVAAELLLGMYDASLDAFVPHDWTMELYKTNTTFRPWNSQDAFNLKSTTQSYFHNKPATENYYFRKYDQMILENIQQVYYTLKESMNDSKGLEDVRTFKGEGRVVNPMAMSKSVQFSPVADTAKNTEEESQSAANQSPPQNPARTNLKETAFFFPDMKTDAEGNIIVHFTLPESLTRWKVMGLAHTKDLKTGKITREVMTQKDLMVFPNPPRFFREGDKIIFTTKISSLSKADLNGQVSLELFDAITLKKIDNTTVKDLFTDVIREISLKAGNSTTASWTFTVPVNYQAITWRVVAKAGSFSDGEEATLPVLSNRQMVTESLSLPVRGKGKFTFDMTKLSDQEKNPSSTLKSHQLSLEFTSNPAWYAIQALPYLMEYPYECSEQTFNRYYADQIATNIATYDPDIRKVFETWSKYTPSALLSNLEKNQDLKSVVLEETPWIMQAKDESERKQRIGLLFDLNRMANEAVNTMRKLNELQAPNGGWPWFAGMPDDRYITQYILSGYGHLQRLGIFKDGEEAIASQMMAKALQYSDQRISEEYKDVLKYSAKTIQDNHLNQSNIQYLYARSFYLGTQEINENAKEAFTYFKGQARKYWTSQNPYLQGMIALALQRSGDAQTPKEIIRSLKERALHNAELGMYWKNVSSGYQWHQQGIATQALLIEAFDEITRDSVAVEDMKLWLLKQKQTTDWKTTTATADACYALLLRGKDLLKNKAGTEITVGNIVFNPMENPALKAEAGTGYFRVSWWGKDIDPHMAKITVDRKDDGIAWGALYWQYFENMEKITAASGPVKIERQLFLKKNTASGPVLEKVTLENPIKTGDKVVARITLISDRDMEYVHLKDLRAAGLEPVDVLSGYQYQDGLGYYQSTKDAATHFFFSSLPKGTRIFEYTMMASLKGEFTQGISSIECMYAPEFSAHSEGLKIKIE